MSGPPGAWQLFERDAAGYEGWYGTARGRRADRAERALLERLLAPLATARSALEVGCGTGHFTRWLAGRLPRVVGLDRASAMLAEARRRHPGLLLVQGARPAATSMAAIVSRLAPRTQISMRSTRRWGRRSRRNTDPPGA